jgi:hypothetical protein
MILANISFMLGESVYYNQRVMRATFITCIISLSVLVGGIIIWDSPDMVSTSYYHANIQYRTGNEVSYRDIIEQTLQYVIWMHGNHSNWHYTLECQLLLLEYVNVNYPHLFQAIKEHNLRGQLELIVPQYSDSFMVPFPGKDLLESMAYTQQRMQELGLRQSKLILLQEGQWLPGFPYIANANHMNGWILSREMLAYFDYYPKTPILEWSFAGHTSHVVVTPWFSDMEAGVYHHVIYIQDSEKINTGDEGSIEGAEFFNYNPLKQANYEARHEELEKKGNKFLTMSEFYEHCIRKGYVSKLDKYIPETDWVAAQYETFFTWMGKGNGAADDGLMLARDYYTHNLIQATELLLHKAVALEGILNWNDLITAQSLLDPIGGIVKPRINSTYTIAEWLLEAKKVLWEAQVTDVTGITPAIFEFQYGLNKTRDAIRICKMLIQHVKNRPGLNPFNVSQLQIIPMNNSVISSPTDFWEIQYGGSTSWSEIQELFGIEIEIHHQFEQIFPHSNSTSMKNLTWNGQDFTLYELNFEFPGKYNISIGLEDDILINNTIFDANNRTEGLTGPNQISIFFKDSFECIAYSPSLSENQTVTLDRSDYYQFPFGSENEWFVRLPACNGLIYNQNSGYGIIKNVTTRHLAGTWRPDSIEFRETEVKYSSKHQYFLVKGTVDELLMLANLLNSRATMEV